MGDPWSENPEGSCPLTSQTMPASGVERSFCLCPCLSQASRAWAWRDLLPGEAATCAGVERGGQGHGVQQPWIGSLALPSASWVILGESLIFFGASASLSVKRGPPAPLIG